jgi:hypothetical protein
MSRIPADSHKHLEQARYGLLLLAVLATGFLGELLEGGPTHRLSRALGFSVILLLGFTVLWGRRTTRRVALVLCVPALAGLWLSPAAFSPAARAGSRALLAAFLVLTTLTLVLDLAQATRVSVNTFYAAVCAYFLVGLVFAVAYGIVELLAPRSFTGSAANLSFGPDSDFMYFSLVTLATLGYGDIAPVSGMARALASLEAVVGQFYVAALVARLVGLMVAPRGPDS